MLLVSRKGKNRMLSSQLLMLSRGSRRKPCSSPAEWWPDQDEVSRFQRPQDSDVAPSYAVFDCLYEIPVL